MTNQTIVNNLNPTMTLYLGKLVNERAETNKYLEYVANAKYKSAYEAAKGIINKYLMAAVINCKNMDIVSSEDEIHWRQFTSMIINDDDLIAQSVEAFISHEEICDIYYYIEDINVQLFILLNNESYNFELMHELYTIERLVKRMWDGKNIEFHYAPERYLDKKVLANFHIAYKRG